MTKPSYGVIVGRFQVNELHEGHRELLDAVFARHKKVIVFLGVSPAGLTKRHPLDFSAREKMIKASYPDAMVLPLKDCMTDEMWSRSLDEKIREVAGYGDVTLYGGRDSFLPFYHGSFKPVELALTKIAKYSGEEIRQRLTDEVMASPDFRAGMIYAAMNQWPRVVTTVDTIIYHKRPDPRQKYGEEYLFLLGRKEGEPGWRFIGGHAEPKTDSFEQDATKEAYEETDGGVAIRPQDWKYIGSCVVPDWRWAKEDSKIKTLIFAGQSMTMSGRGADDIAEAKWLPVPALHPGLFVDTHRPLFEIVKKHFKEVFDVPAIKAQSTVGD